MVPASRRLSQNSSIHFRGFSGEFDFNVPNEEMSAITHRIIQGEQALQMYQCQMQPYQYQMGNLQTQAQIQQFRWMSQRGHVTDTQRSVLPDWAVSEPQNQVDTRRGSRSRPPLTDDRRRIDRVEESTRGPCNRSCKFVSAPSSGTIYTYDSNPWFILSFS